MKILASSVMNLFECVSALISIYQKHEMDARCLFSVFAFTNCVVWAGELVINNMTERDQIGWELTSTQSHLSPQISLIYSIPRYLAKSFKVVIPYFPTGLPLGLPLSSRLKLSQLGVILNCLAHIPSGTMERIESMGEVATAMTLARLLSVVPLAQLSISSFSPDSFFFFKIRLINTMNCHRLRWQREAHLRWLSLIFTHYKTDFISRTLNLLPWDQVLYLYEFFWWPDN